VRLASCPNRRYRRTAILSGVVSEEWTPRVVVVRRATRLPARHTKERRVRGTWAGQCDDGRLGNLPSPTSRTGEVLVVALASLFKLPVGECAWRFRSPMSKRAVAGAQPMVPFDLGYSPSSPFDTHARLALPAG
jgi:hypothetical protein